MDEAKNQINDSEHMKAKNHADQQEEKIIQINEDILSSCRDNFRHSNIGIIRPNEKRKARRRRESARNWKFT